MGFKDPERKKEYNREYHQSIKEKANERSKLWYRDNEEKRLEYRKKYKEERLPTVLYTESKTRAKRLGLNFNLDKEDIVVPDVCPVFGFELKPGRGKVTPGSPSVDKIKPELGYTKGNIQVISHKANKMKQDATPEELRMFARWVLKTFPEESDGKA